MSEPGDVTLAATLPELSFTATAIPDAKATLLANLPPLTFVASTGTLAGAALAATLPALVFAAQAVPVTDVALAGSFPPLELVAEARYQSYAVRPVTGQSATRWRHAASHDAGAEDRREATVREHAPTRAPWQAAGPRVAGVEYRRHSTRVRAPVANRETWLAWWGELSARARARGQPGVAPRGRASANRWAGGTRRRHPAAHGAQFGLRWRDPRRMAALGAAASGRLARPAIHGHLAL
jgi:hypothetical protein